MMIVGALERFNEYIRAGFLELHIGLLRRRMEKMEIEKESQHLPSHYVNEVVASVKTKRQSQPVKTKNMTKPKNKPVPKMVQKWVPKIATPTKSVDPKESSEEV
jgi:hypothetical protein